MDSLDDILARAAERPGALNEEEREFLLSLERPEEVAALHRAARMVKMRECGKGVALRALIECGNICTKDCFYCGIRRSNRNIRRYAQSEEEIVAELHRAAASGFGSAVLQAGETESESNANLFESVLRQVRHLDLGITLSLGEQSEETYRRWKAAGARRYLLRIETSDPELYASLHPDSHRWQRRLECLESLHRLGYQTGTGIMCGLPGQSLRSVARDIGFFAKIDADMIGSGPYLPHPDTPLAGHDDGRSAEERLRLGLNLIAVTRLHLHDVNIASATALQALREDGREQGVAAGANVIMPNLTDESARANYRLYPGKPQLDCDTASMMERLRHRLDAIGETIVNDASGDSKHFARRNR